MSLISATTKKYRFLAPLFMLAIFWFAYIFNFINIQGLFFSFILFILSANAFTQKKMILKIIFNLAFFIFGLFFLFHKIPGIFNINIFHHYELSPNSYPYSLYFNFDKLLFGFLTLYFSQMALDKRTLKQNFRLLFQFFLLTCLILFCAAYLLNFIRYDFKIYSFTPLWFIHNFFLTVLIEETIFRGYILKKLLNTRQIGAFVAISLSAVLFGICHFNGGARLIILATIAGIFYGLVYLKTKHLQYSVLLHAAVNLTHFIFFSYPAWKI